MLLILGGQTFYLSIHSFIHWSPEPTFCLMWPWTDPPCPHTRPLICLSVVVQPLVLHSVAIAQMNHRQYRIFKKQIISNKKQTKEVGHCQELLEIFLCHLAKKNEGIWGTLCYCVLKLKIYVCDSCSGLSDRLRVGHRALSINWNRD